MLILTSTLSLILLSSHLAASQPWAKVLGHLRFDYRQMEGTMYQRSYGLFALSAKNHGKVIYPFLNKLETELKSAQFCKKNPDCLECNNYLDSLLSYHNACLYNYAQNNRKTNMQYIAKKLELEGRIKSLASLANQDVLKPNEVATELQKTEHLCLEANEAFYAALQRHLKVGLWLDSRE